MILTQIFVLTDAGTKQDKIMKKERKNFLLNYKGKKFKANTLFGIVWKFLLKKRN